MEHFKDKELRMVKVKFLLLVPAVGLLSFLLISTAFPFKNAILRTLFPKSFSRAAELDKTPKVNLRLQGTINDRIVSVGKDHSPIILVWTTSGSPTSCLGRNFGLTATDNSWAGPKNPQGGTFTISSLSVNNPYIYTIDCSNKEGDADGSSVTINVGAQSFASEPYLTTFDVAPTEVAVGDKVAVKWSSLNTSTPYSICISSGSWTRGYKNIKNFKSTEELTIPESRIYKFTVYCSNEKSYTQNTQAIFAND